MKNSDNSVVKSILNSYEQSLRKAAKTLADSPEANARAQAIIAVFNAVENGTIAEESAEAAILYYRKHGMLPESPTIVTIIVAFLKMFQAIPVEGFLNNSRTELPSTPDCSNAVRAALDATEPANRWARFLGSHIEWELSSRDTQRLIRARPEGTYRWQPFSVVAYGASGELRRVNVGAAGLDLSQMSLLVVDCERLELVFS